MERFKEFTGQVEAKKAKYNKRVYNFLVCSVYRDDFNKKRYLGFAQNFVELAPKEKALKRSAEGYDASNFSDSIMPLDTTAATYPQNDPLGILPKKGNKTPDTAGLPEFIKSRIMANNK